MVRRLASCGVAIAVTIFGFSALPAQASGSIKAKPKVSPSSSATPKPTVTSRATSTPKPSASPKATSSTKPSSSPSPSRTVKPTPTASTKPTASPRPSVQPTTRPSASASASPSASPSISPKPKPSPKRIVLPEVTLDPPPRSPLVDKAIAYALLQVGKSYVRGATGPNSFDCSGLVQKAWQQAGIKLPRTSGQQLTATIHIAMTDALPGDLVFYGQSGVQHVAMYIGFGLIVEAANPAKGVVISPINTPWHNNNFGGIGRVLAPASPVTQP